MDLAITNSEDLNKLEIELYNRHFVLKFNNGHFMYRKFIYDTKSMFELRGYHPGDVWIISFDVFANQILLSLEWNTY